MKTIAYIAAAVVGTVAATIAVHCIVYAILSSAPQENAMRTLNTVEDICDYSRSVVSGEWEEACGMAQDTAGVEYICSSFDPSADCYVKDKRGEL
jgi:glycerol uptake facilitator-like aquaporin